MLHLGLGSQFLIPGIDVNCIIGGGNPVVIGCGPVRDTPHGYFFLPGHDAFAISDGQTGLTREVAKGGFPITDQVYEPSISGATFSTGVKKTDFTVSPQTAVLVGGSHIFCAVSHTATAGTNIACGVTTTAKGYHYPAGTYVVAVNNTFDLLARVEANGSYKTIKLKSQP